MDYVELNICFLMKKEFYQLEQMILSKSKEDRNIALEKLLPHQKNDFIEIFKIMNGLPVTVRLLDPPFHEFLPKNDKEINDVAKSLILLLVKKFSQELPNCMNKIQC